MLLLASAASSLHAQSVPDSIPSQYRDVAARIIQAATADSSAYDRLGRLVDGFGNRLSGSESLERAIDWVLAAMRHDDLDSAWTEPVMVPHWVRGEESAELIAPRRARLPMLGLGMSVGTPKKGVTAPVLVVSSFDDLTARSAEVKGKIVLYDVPFTNYGATVRYRGGGALAAEQYGAVAVLVRSVTPYSMRTPHTGSMRYDSLARIPAAAITVEDAMMLHRMQDRGDRIVVHLTMGASLLPDAPSRNVLGQITGREHPEEVIVLGGHIDSWDVGQGAMDDGGGMVAAWEAVHLLRRLGLTPRRTLRAVGWTNEENGIRGGKAYRDSLSPDQLAHHVLALESDGGAFRPRGFSFTGSDAGFDIIRQVSHLLAPLEADSISRGGGEADIGPLMERGVPGMGLLTQSDRYFWFHHTDGDTLDKLDPADFARCVAVFAIMAYVVADLPEPLPR
jgi:carboxypeptidase Q